MKRITISMENHFYNAYLTGCHNISSRIRRLVELGAEAEINNPENNKNQLLRLINQIEDLRAENRQLQLKIASYQAKLKTNKRNPDQDPITQKIRGLKDSGIMGDILD